MVMTQQEEGQEDRLSGVFQVIGKKIPRAEVVYFSQILIIFVIIAVSLFNISRGHESESLWVSLLSSSLGYALPNPTLTRKQQNQQTRSDGLLRHSPQ